MNEDYMTPDYYEKEYSRYKDRYAGPYMEDGREESAENRRERQHYQRCMNLVGRVISQKGLEGALVLSYHGNKDRFKIRLQNGKIVNGEWAYYYGWEKDPSGISSNGWNAGDVQLEPGWNEIPF